MLRRISGAHDKSSPIQFSGGNCLKVHTSQFARRDSKGMKSLWRRFGRAERPTSPPLPQISVCVSFQSGFSIRLSAKCYLKTTLAKKRKLDMRKSQSAGGVHVAEEKNSGAELARPRGNFHSAQIFCPCATKRTRKFAIREK